MKGQSSVAVARSMPLSVQRAMDRARQAARDTASRLPRVDVRGDLTASHMRTVRTTALLVDGRDARAARRLARRLGLPRTLDDTGAWAALGALAATLRIADHGSRTAVVVDPAGRRSTFTRWAVAAGFAPVAVDVTDPDITNRTIDDGCVDVIVQLHPNSATAQSVDIDLALSADALRRGGIVVVTLRLGPHEDGGVTVADLRSLVARMAEQGLHLVGELDLDDARRARAAHVIENGSFGLALLTFRRR